MLIDWMGVRTRIPMLPWAPSDLAGTVSTALPIPDDGYRSEDVEYAALARALHGVSDHPVRVVEVGAGWAPWAMAAMVAHLQRRFRVVRVKNRYCEDVLEEVSAERLLQEFHSAETASDGLGPGGPQ